MGGFLKGLSTTTFVATRVALLVGAGLVAVAAGSAVKDRLFGGDDDVDLVEIDGTTEGSDN